MTRITTKYVSLALTAFLLLSATQFSFAEQRQRARVLVVTGIEFHSWWETAPQIGRQLALSPELDVRVEPDYNILATDEIFNYDVIFFNFANLVEYTETKDDDLAIDNIERFLREGGGIVIYHLAIGMFERRTDRILPLIGRNYCRILPPHDPFRVFEVSIMDREHPITRHIPNFRIYDELYTCLYGDLPIHVLAQAFSPEQLEYYPIAYLHRYGEGYAFTTTLGHCMLALQSQEHVTMLRNAVLWLAGREVPAELEQVLPPGQPLPRVIPPRYPPNEAANIARMEQIRETLATNETLLLYFDCGREWQKTAATGESFATSGDTHRFPGSWNSGVTVTPNQEFVLVGLPTARVFIEGLNPEKKYRIYFTWWDFNNGGPRVQYVRLYAKDGSRNVPVIENARLPNFVTDGQGPETRSFDIDASFVADGGVVLEFGLVSGHNTVVSEIWLVEVE